MVSAIFSPVINLFKFHKLKLLGFIACYLFIVYLLFPFSDLGDLVATKISEVTQGQFFVDFDKLDLSLIPQPGLELTNVNVDSPFTGTLSAKTLDVAPSISGLLSLKPGVSIHAAGFLGGIVDVSTRGGDKTAAGKRRERVQVDLDGMNLTAIAKTAGLPIPVEGSISGGLDTLVDPDFTEQPSGTILLKGTQAVIPEGNLVTPFGPILLPRMNLGEIDIEGKADKGSIDISKLVLGKPGGDFYANVSGRLDLKIQRYGANVQPLMGGYDVNVRLSVGDAAKQRLGPFLAFIQTFSTGGNSYAFKLTGINAYSPPNITRIQ